MLYDGEDNDLYVSESSASSVFPDYAKTAFEGLANHNHVTLARDGEVSPRVLELLRGGTAPETEYFGADDGEPDTQSVKIYYGNGESKIFKMNRKLHMRVNDDVKLELFAHTPRGDYDIAAPALGLAK